MEVGRGVCAVVVTYNPEPTLLSEVLTSAAGQVEELIILDNGSGPEGRAGLERAVADTRAALPAARLTLGYSPTNRGLPIPFNEAIEKARVAGHRFLLILDHDSVLQPGSAASLVAEYERLHRHVDVGALEAFNDEPMVLPTDDFLDGFYRRRDAGLGGGVSDDFLATGSGLFVPLGVFQRTGGFDETYFLDALDFEFSLRLRAHGLRVLRVPSARIRHQRGERATADQRGRWWGGVRMVRPVRHYYVARDVLRTWSRYGRRFPLVGLFLLSMPVRETILVLCFYRERRAHLHYLGLGVLDALTGVSGPLQPTAPRTAR